jgi:ketosteroid isomerase-like protein
VSDIDDVRERAAGWQAAIEARDTAAVQEFLHDEFALVLVVPSPVTMLRDEWLRVLGGYVFHGHEVHEQVVHVVGDVASVLTLATQRATVLGADRSGRFVLTDTWVRAGVTAPWRVWRRHSTPSSGDAMPRG